MAKEKQWADWSDFMKGDRGAPPDHRSKPVTTGPVLQKGEVPRKPSDAEIRGYIMKDAPKQPTDQQMFGHLEVTEEMAKKATHEWETRFTKFFRTDHGKL